MKSLQGTWNGDDAPRAGVFKPDPRVDQIALDRLGLAKDRIGFVSSNCWDAGGAKSFGFTSYWINRGGAPLDALEA